MHQVLSKHVNAVDTYGSDFAAELGAGEFITGTPVLTITKGHPTRVDKTSELVGIAPQISGTQVFVTLKKRAAAGEQKTGMYEVKVEVATNTARTLVDAWELKITDHAVP